METNLMGTVNFQPAPRGLTPNHEIVIFIALGQKIVHVGTLHGSRHALSHHVRGSVPLQSSGAKIQESVIQVEDRIEVA